MVENIFMQDEDGVEAMAFPVCSSCRDYKNCRIYDCLDNGASLAMAYVPMQKFQNLYTPEEALANGTLFMELDKPWLGRKARGKGGC